MKSLLGIVRRYTINAVLITLVILLFNAGAFVFLVYQAGKENVRTDSLRDTLALICGEVSKEGESYVLSEEGYEALSERGYVWAMLLDAEGSVVWAWNLPEDFPGRYSLTEVAGFARWYYRDYPVRVWGEDGMLLVTGSPKDSVVKLDLEYPARTLRAVPSMIRIFFVLNVLLLLVLAFWFAFRFYRALRPIAEGIEALAKGKETAAPERGLTGELAGKLNQTSRTLQAQREKLRQRDDARTQWISGVSHDIRTPLSLILGVSDELAADPSLGEEQRKGAEIIKKQSLQIRQLIADLNLTSKLEYHAQPLRLSWYSPAGLLRETVTEYYNNGLEERYGIELRIGQKEEELLLEGDTALLKRALQNIIGNSIRHNPEGVSLTITLKAQGRELFWDFLDTGSGIPGRVAKLLNQNRQEADIHIMGLRIVRQIVVAHGGRLTFPLNQKTGTYGLRFSLPVRTGILEGEATSGTRVRPEEAPPPGPDGQVPQ